MNLSKYEHAERKEAEASKDAPETPQDSGAEQKHHTLFGKQFTEKEQKTLFLYLVIGIVLMELAVTVGAIIISITNAQPSSSGVPHFQFPWIGYLVAVVMVPVLAMLLVNLVSLGFSRGARGGEDVNLEGVPQRMQTFYALVRGAPTVILFAGFVLMCAAIYYLDGVMSLLLKLGENFHLVAIWVVGGFAVAWMVSYVVRAWMHYKTKQMEAEYAFRHEVLERTGMVILDTKHAPTTELRMLPPAPRRPARSPASRRGCGRLSRASVRRRGAGGFLPNDRGCRQREKIALPSRVRKMFPANRPHRPNKAGLLPHETPIAARGVSTKRQALPVMHRKGLPFME